MKIPIERKDSRHLLHLILNRSFSVPNFALLLGSGASATSNVKTAEEMIDGWRRMLYERDGSNRGYQLWLKSQPWCGHDDEYSLLFESIFDQPSQRRVYIEDCVKDSHPSWGYVYLANLLSHNFFDVVFTTNFDDLMNEACYLYSDGLRPIVGAHDSSIREIRVTSRRPKIVKLHGDFMYDSIKNTIAELETLEANTTRKLKQFAQEYGLVVIGYSGRDRSVMDTIDLLLRDEENYRQGVYWCIRRGAEVSNRLASLLMRDRVYLIEVDGFDEFMADLHKEAQLALPRAIASPMEMARDRARIFVEVKDTLRDHPVINSDLKKVLSEISNQVPAIPLPVQAARLASLGQYDEAADLWEQAYQDGPSDNRKFALLVADTLWRAGRVDRLVEFVEEAAIDADTKAYYLLLAGADERVVALADGVFGGTIQVDEDEDVNEDILRVNRAIAFKRLKMHDRMNADLDFLEQSGAVSNVNIRAGVAALRRRKDDMLEALEVAVGDSISREGARVFPVFEDFREDEDFIRLVSGPD